MRWLVPLLFTALFAGCTDSPEETDGFTDGMASEAEPVYETVTIVEIIETPVEWLDGETNQGAWACSTPNCAVGGHTEPDNSYTNQWEYPGNLTHVTLTLEWTKADPSVTGLETSVRGLDTGTSIAFQNGPSTFTIDVDASIADETAVWMGVWPMAKEGSSSTYVDPTDQPFTVTGTIFSEITRTEERLVEPSS